MFWRKKTTTRKTEPVKADPAAAKPRPDPDATPAAQTVAKDDARPTTGRIIRVKGALKTKIDDT